MDPSKIRNLRMLLPPQLLFVNTIYCNTVNGIIIVYFYSAAVVYYATYAMVVPEDDGGPASTVWESIRT